MDNRYYNSVVKEMQSLLDSQGFKADGDAFINENYAVKVEYNETKQMYILNMAEINEGEIGEYAVLSSWLFDDSQTERDAQSVGIDFTSDLRKKLGVKVQHVGGVEVELPTASKTGAMTITGFAKKMLDVYPALKDSYKEHIAQFGNFLYLDFFGKFLVPNLKETFTKGTKKQVSKLYDVFEDAYVKGDKDTVNVLVAVLAAAAYNDTAVDEGIVNMLTVNENSHFLTAYNSFKGALKGNAKLLKALNCK